MKNYRHSIQIKETQMLKLLSYAARALVIIAFIAAVLICYHRIQEAIAMHSHSSYIAK